MARSCWTIAWITPSASSTARSTGAARPSPAISTATIARTPLRPFEPHHPLLSPGAWEVVARLSSLRVDESVFDPGPKQLVNPSNFTPEAVETTLGFNWYLNAWVRMQFNWEHAMFQHRVNLG